MPFRPGGAETGPTTGTLQVNPAQVLQLKAELRPIYTEVEDFLYNKGRNMMMKALGADPVSVDTADAFNANAQSALDAAYGFLGALEGVLDALDQAGNTYNVVEEVNTHAFRRALR